MTHPMSLFVTGLLLASALVHASWNALVKSSADRLWSISIITLIGGLAALPFAIWVGPPVPASWPFLALSCLLQIGYCLFLAKAYELGDLASVYPIARGSAPLLVTLGAALFAGEVPDAYGLLGVLLVSLGILILSSGKGRPDIVSAIAALVTGVFIASYMVVDGLGVRIAEHALRYIAWQALCAGLMIPLVYVLITRRGLSLPRGRDGAAIVAAGILGTLGYCIAVWAMSLSGMGGVSAVRETSILFAAVIGIVLLGEKLTIQKVLGALIITGGVVLLSVG